MAIGLIRSKTALLTVNATSVSATLTGAAITAGKLLVIQHSWTTGSTADNNVPAGFTQIGEIRYSVAVPIATALYYRISDGSESLTFTVDTGAVSTIQEITVAEFGGGASYILDTTVLTNSVGGVTTITSPTLTVANQDEIILYAVACHGTATWLNTWTNGFARVESSPPANNRATMGYLVSTSAAAYVTAETINAARSMVGVMASFTVTSTAQTTTVTQTIKYTVSVSAVKNATPQRVKPISDVSNPGLWTQNNGVTTTALYSTIDDVTTDDADYDISPNNPSAAVATVRLGAVQLTGNNNGWNLRVRHKLFGTGSTTCTVALKQGATTIMAARSCTLTAGWVDQVFDLTPAEAALITNGALIDLVITAG